MNANFIVFGLTRRGIEPESTASVADALSTRPLIDLLCRYPLEQSLSKPFVAKKEYLYKNEDQPQRLKLTVISFSVDVKIIKKK